MTTYDWERDKAFWSAPGRADTFDIEECGSGYSSYRDMVKQKPDPYSKGGWVRAEDYQLQAERAEAAEAEVQALKGIERNLRESADILKEQAKEAEAEVARLNKELDAKHATLVDVADKLRSARTAINACVDYSNGRACEWGERAQSCFQFLHDYLDSQAPGGQNGG